jgi:hypothetical protein
LTTKNITLREKFEKFDFECFNKLIREDETFFDPSSLEKMIHSFNLKQNESFKNENQKEIEENYLNLREIQNRNYAKEKKVFISVLR